MLSKYCLPSGVSFHASQVLTVQIRIQHNHLPPPQLEHHQKVMELAKGHRRRRWQHRQMSQLTTLAQQECVRTQRWWAVEVGSRRSNKNDWNKSVIRPTNGNMDSFRSPKNSSTCWRSVCVSILNKTKDRRGLRTCLNKFKFLIALLRKSYHILQAHFHAFRMNSVTICMQYRLRTKACNKCSHVLVKVNWTDN